MNRTGKTLLALAAAAWLAPGARAQQAPPPMPPGMFPFVLPWNDSAKTITDVSALNPAPLDARRRVVVKDGRFADGTGRRVRFVGTNFTFSANFPNKEDAEAIAARLHKYGFNCVRMHHMDMHKAPRGIFDPNAPGKQKLDAEQMDRLDYLISQFKQHGIYVNFNLHVSRLPGKDDGFPDTEKLETHGKVVSYFEPKMIQLQKDFARDLLTHYNRYTKTRYVDEPTVALVEITNEDTLLGAVWGSGIESLPDYYRNQLRTQWNEWLLAKYKTTEGLKRGWGAGKPLGENILKNGDFSAGAEGWTLEQNTAPARAEMTVEDADSGKALHVKVLEVGSQPWHLQLHQRGMEFTPGGSYTLTFRAKASAPRPLSVYTGMTVAPWRHTGLDKAVTLTTEWKRYSAVFNVPQPEPGNNRLSFVIGAAGADVWLDDVTIRPGIAIDMEPGESLETKTVALGAPTTTQQGQDYLQFLVDTERRYARDMKDYIQKTLKSKSLVTNSQASYGGIGGVLREADMDWVDMHAYWQHPNFPNKPWDPQDWRIPNTSMIRDERGGTLSRLAVHRVAGKPFTVTEYNHPAPNEYAAESMPVIFAYAAWQDWDGVFLFDYNSDRDRWNSDKIRGFFGSDTNPSVMAFLPAAATLFLRGDLEPSTAGTLTLQVPRSEAVSLLAKHNSIENLFRAHSVTPEDLIRYRTSVQWTNGGSVKVDKKQIQYIREPDSELIWKPGPSEALFTVESPRSLAVIGFPGSKPASATRLTVDAEPTERGFLTLTLTSTDGKPVGQSTSLLLTAGGKVANPGMVWNEARNSISNKWGTGPVHAEGIPATVSLQTDASGLTVYALDPTGARTGTVPSTVQNGRLTFKIGPEYKALWYEISAHPTPVRSGTTQARR